MLLFAIQIIHPTNFSTYSRLHPCVRWTVMHILEARTRVLASRIRARVGHGHDTLRTLFFFIYLRTHIGHAYILVQHFYYISFT